MIVQSKTFMQDYKLLIKKHEIKLIQKIDILIASIEIDGCDKGAGRPERLKHYGARCVYSREITKLHRLVYECFPDSEKIILHNCYEHYDKKPK